MASAILKVRPNQKEEVREHYLYDDIKLNKDVEHFDSWIRKQNHFRVREFDKNYLERYLIYNKGSIERAKRHFDRMCTFRNLMPELLRDFDIRNEFEPLLNTIYMAPMPNPTSDNYRIFIVKVFGNDNRFELLAYYRYIIVLVEYVLYNDYCLGYELIVDLREISLNIVSKLNPLIINKAVTLLVETMGQRIKNIHILSGSKFFTTIIGITKKALSEKLNNRIIIHDSVDTIKDYIAKDNLPEDYNGTDKSVKEYSDMMFKAISSDEHIERMKFLETATTDESCRLSVKFNEEYSGMPGSFKTLCVD